MTILQRVDRLKEPPVVGKFYLVPTVYGRWHDKITDWPVIGNRHNDVEFFGLHAEHYHLDYRFVQIRKPWLASTAPLHAHSGVPLRKPVLSRRKCLRDQHLF